MQHSVFDCLPVFVVMDNAGLKSLRAAWLESVEKVWTFKIWLRPCFAWKMIEQNIIAWTSFGFRYVCMPLAVSLEMGNPSTPIDS